MAFFINEKCTSCNACMPECPTGSIFIGKTRYLIDADTCRDCRLCVGVCPVEAIHKVVDAEAEKKAKAAAAIEKVRKGSHD